MFDLGSIPLQQWILTSFNVLFALAGKSTHLAASLEANQACNPQELGTDYALSFIPPNLVVCIEVKNV